MAFGRFAANHGDDPLLLGAVEHLRGTGSRTFEQSTFQAAGFIPVRNLTNSLRSQLDKARNLWRTRPSSKLQQGERTQDHSNLLHTATEQLSNLL